METQALIAIYAAIVATSALLLNFKSWLDSGPKLHLSLMVNAATIGSDPELEENDLIILTVTNRGDAATLITHMAVLKYHWSWKRLRFVVVEAWIIAHPQLKGYPPNIPSELKPANRWSGALRKRQDIFKNIHSGEYHLAIQASHRDRLYMIRVPKSKKSAIDNAKTV